MKAVVGENVAVKFRIVSDPYWGEISKHILNRIGAEITKTKFVIKESEVLFSKVSVEDSGTYKISCENQAGVGSASFELDITPPLGNITLCNTI